MRKQEVEQLLAEVVTLSAQYASKNREVTFRKDFEYEDIRRFIDVPNQFIFMFRTNTITLKELIKYRNTLRFRLNNTQR